MKESVIEQGPDGGPIYIETNLNAFIAEPFNALTAIFFIGIAVYWLFKLRKDFKEHIFLTVTSFILLIGGIGGTIYHAFRLSRVALVMDWLPIVILCFSASVYFLMKLFGRWYFGILSLVLFFLLEWLNFIFIPSVFAVNVSYSLMALLILLPLLFYLKKQHWRNKKWVLIALLSFIIAITSRTIDHFQLLPIGTYFLWYTFGAIACHSMFCYLYLDNKLVKNELINA